MAGFRTTRRKSGYALGPNGSGSSKKHLERRKAKHDLRVTEKQASKKRIKLSPAGMSAKGNARKHVK